MQAELPRWVLSVLVKDLRRATAWIPPGLGNRAHTQARIRAEESRFLHGKNFGPRAIPPSASEAMAERR